MCPLVVGIANSLQMGKNAQRFLQADARIRPLQRFGIVLQNVHASFTFCFLFYSHPVQKVSIILNA